MKEIEPLLFFRLLSLGNSTKGNDDDEQIRLQTVRIRKHLVIFFSCSRDDTRRLEISWNLPATGSGGVSRERDARVTVMWISANRDTSPGVFALVFGSSTGIPISAETILGTRETGE